PPLLKRRARARREQYRTFPYSTPLRFATKWTPSFHGGRKAEKLAVDSHELADPDEAVEAVRPARRAGEEVEVVGRPGGGAVAERDRPETVDRDRRPVRDSQLTLVHPLAVAALLVGADAPIAEVPDQEVAAVGAEVRRRHRESPGRVQRRVRGPLRRDPSDELAVRRELVDLPETAARDAVLLLLVLLRVGDEEVAVQRLDVERRPSRRDVLVDERQRQRLEGRIERVDTRVVEVGRVQTVVQEGEPVVDGALPGGVDHRHGGGAVDRRRPAPDPAGLR